ncbi:MAG: YggT family protein [Gemmatimonadales bacterium]
MPVILGAIDSALGVVRGAFLVLAAVLAVVSGVDWLVRTRKLDPFGRVARFMRANVQPLILPVERRVVRAGGLPSSAPWWALVLVVVAGIVVISVLEFVRTQLSSAVFAFGSGPAAIYRLAVAWTFELLQVALIVRVILSWVHARPGSWIVRWSWRLTEWFLRPLRRLIPPLGMIDITPLIAWLLLGLVEGLLVRLV